MIEIIIHNISPRVIGFQPAAFMFSTDNPAPIKNSVNTNMDFEIAVTESVSKSGKGR